MLLLRRIYVNCICFAGSHVFFLFLYVFDGKRKGLYSTTGYPLSDYLALVPSIFMRINTKENKTISLLRNSYKLHKQSPFSHINLFQ